MDANLVLYVGSTFVCNSLAEQLRRNLAESGLAVHIRTSAPVELKQHMLAPDANSEDISGTVVLVRVEDWIRGVAEGSDEKSTRQQLKASVEEFLGEVSVLAMRGRPVWLVVCPSAGWIAEKFKLASLCRTYTNLLAARLRNLPQITLLACPESLSKDEFYDREQDQRSHVPFTPAGFEQLGESLARQLAAILSVRNSKAIASSSSAGSPELANFLSGLRLQVNVAAAKPSDSGDVGNILRTAASFSLAGERPTLAESEAEAIIASQNCWLVRVSDRLSDSGTSGVVVARPTDGMLVVETLSLSCTVLGKQVEFALLGALQEIARKRNLPSVAFEYHGSGRNQPALAFLKSFADEVTAERYVLPVGETEARVGKAAVAPGAWTIMVER